jgi:hypothetical protein
MTALPSQPEPYHSYDLATVRAACKAGTLDQLNWRASADGTPHDGIDRICVCMPDSDTDLLIQSANGGSGPFRAFPAELWRKQPHPAERQFRDIFDKLDLQRALLEKTIHRANEDVSTGNPDMLRHSSVTADAAYTYHQAQWELRASKTILAGITRFIEETTELTAALDPLAPRITSQEALHGLQENYRSYQQGLTEFAKAVQVNYDDAAHAMRYYEALVDPQQPSKAMDDFLRQTRAQRDECMKQWPAAVQAVNKATEHAVAGMSENMAIINNETGIMPGTVAYSVRESVAAIERDTGKETSPAERLDTVLEKVAKMQINRLATERQPIPNISDTPRDGKPAFAKG